MDKGEFVMPFVASKFPKQGWMRCDSDLLNPLYHFIYAESPEDFDVGIEKGRLCQINFLTAYLPEMKYSPELTYIDYFNPPLKTIDQKITVSDLVSKLILSAGVDLMPLYNKLPIKTTELMVFKSQSSYEAKKIRVLNRTVFLPKHIEILGDHINCDIQDIKANLLSCDLKWLNINKKEKLYYIDGLASLKKILQEKCYCKGCSEAGCPEGMSCFSKPELEPKPKPKSDLVSAPGLIKSQPENSTNNRTMINAIGIIGVIATCVLLKNTSEKVIIILGLVGYWLSLDDTQSYQQRID